MLSIFPHEISQVGGAALGWSCFGASDLGPVSFRRVGQSVDLPVKARRWGQDLRGSPQSGCLKSWSRPPQPQRVSPTSCPQLASAPPGAASRGGDRRQAAPQRRRAPAPCAGLESVEKVVTQSVASGFKSCVHGWGSMCSWWSARGRKSAGCTVHVMRVLA